MFVTMTGIFSVFCAKKYVGSWHDQRYIIQIDGAIVTSRKVVVEHQTLTTGSILANSPRLFAGRGWKTDPTY